MRRMTKGERLERLDHLDQMRRLVSDVLEALDVSMGAMTRIQLMLSDCCLVAVLGALRITLCLPVHLGPVATFLVSLSGAGTAVGLAEYALRRICSGL